jgi:hypothetical protein
MSDFKVLLSYLLFFLTCSDVRIKDTPAQPPAVESFNYDTTRYTHKYVADSCRDGVFADRSVNTFLNNEYAVVWWVSGYTVLARSKYDRLWVCNMPLIRLKVNDTIVVSGTVYNVSGNERGRGLPTVLTHVITK